MWLAVLTALAQPPPLPTWTAADRETFDEEDSDLGRVQGPPSHPAAAPTTTALQPIEVPYAWADDATLSVALSGELGRRYYLTITARRGPLVAHWQQGPYAGEDQTTWIAIQAPDGLLTPLRAVGQADLTVRIDTATLSGGFIGSGGLPPAIVEPTDDTIRRVEAAPEPERPLEQVIDLARYEALAIAARQRRSEVQ